MTSEVFKLAQDKISTLDNHSFKSLLIVNIILIYLFPYN